MKLQRINQILEGKNYHYILINHFKFLENSEINNIRDFSLQFVNSEYFLNEYVADITKNWDNKLQFPFNIEMLENNDIHAKDEYIIDFLLNNFILEYKKAGIDVTNGFGDDFQFSVNVLKNYISNFKFDNKFSLLTTDDFPHTSEKVVDLYQIMNYIVDYFYFGIIPLKNNNEFITFESAYE